MMRVPSFVLRPLLRWARGISDSRPPDQIIGNPSAPYMLRWHIFRNPKWGGIYIHHFLRDDDDRALHDHPFKSLSICLSGRMSEIHAAPGRDAQDPARHARRSVQAGDVIYRGAEFSHRMEIMSDDSWTLFFIGPREREWGFWCPKHIGWRHWRQYADPVNPGEVGRGCAD